ncbi:MAG: DUF1016 family protein [Bacteroidales bacterium]|nr:DUF1016 family protein [Bacteroidales bacterium]
MDKKTVRIIPSNPDDFERQFAYVDSIINKHRTTAIATVNMESLLTAWEVGQYISIQLKSSHWGSKVVSELADYLKRQNPKRRGFGKRNLYNMVKFFDTYNTVEFARITQKSKISEFVQLETAQIGSMEESNEIVQLPTAQLSPDRDVKRDNENPSIGIILCPSADRSMVEYTLSRSLSPTMVTEYRRKLIPQEVMQKSLDEYCSYLGTKLNENIDN